MGSGIRDVQIYFENPIIVTQRQDEGLFGPDDFESASVAIKEEYPSGSFGYSQATPMSMRFHRPLQLHSMYIKQHRSADHYLNNSAGIYYIQAFLEDKLVLNVTIFANNLIWRQYLPTDFLIIDRLVLPPGLDIDNLMLQVDMNSQEYHIPLQNFRTKPQTQMMEKTMNLRNDRGFIKKDAAVGYTASLTHPSEYTPYVKSM